MRFFLFIIFALAAFGGTAFAQDQQQLGPYDKELAGFYSYCQNDTYLGTNHNCQCLTKQYLDIRTEKGPSPKSPEIMKDLDLSTCLLNPKKFSGKGLDEDFDLSEVPDEIIEDAEQFYEFCKGDARYGTNFDCECLAGEYLERRVEEGALDIPRSHLMMEMADSCPNVEEAAGEAYSECYKQATLMPLNQPLDRFCECYARTYAKLRGNFQGYFSSQMRISTKSRAMVMCQTDQSGRHLMPGAVLK